MKKETEDGVEEVGELEQSIDVRALWDYYVTYRKARRERILGVYRSNFAHNQLSV